MHISAITAEYNPFHRGHAYHLAETRRLGATHIVAVMSGSFVQRGEPAVFSKFARAEAAVRCGVDLVLELPVRFSLGASERFAAGSLSLIRSIGCVDSLSFGCETADLDALQKTATACASPSVRTRAKTLTEEGISYPAALSRAVAEAAGNECSAVLDSPNNLLAVDYLQALAGSRIQPLAVARRGAEHDAPIGQGKFASASALRQAIRTTGQLPSWGIPDEAAAVFCRELAAGRTILLERLDLLVLLRLREMTRSDFHALPDCSSGLGDRLYTASRTARSLEELIETAKTRRYTLSRVRRAAMCALVGIRGNEKPCAPYARILAIGSGGEAILSKMRKSSSIPFSSSLAMLSRQNDLCAQFAKSEERATDLHALLMHAPAPCGTDYTTKLYKEVGNP